jgi:hypothetical protein
MRILLVSIILICAQATAVTIQPDKPRNVPISAKDINRVMCVDGMVQDAFYSEEKVQQVSIVEDKVIIKLPIKQEGDVLTYAKNIVDFDIICNGLAYKFFAEPREDLRGQIIYLGDPNVTQALQNLQILNGMDVEDQYVMLMDAVLSSGRLNNQLFESLVKEDTHQTLNLSSRPLVLQNSYRFNGAGLRVKQYRYPAKQGEQFREEQFLLPEVSSKAKAITVQPLTMATDGFVTVMVIEGVN